MLMGWGTSNEEDLQTELMEELQNSLTSMKITLTALELVTLAKNLAIIAIEWAPDLVGDR